MVMDPQLEQLVGAARQQTLAAFDKAVSEGERDPAAEIGEYQRRRRDYATWLRMEQPAPEARELAGSLLDRHGLAPDDASREDFELEITRMLLELYEEFIRRA